MFRRRSQSGKLQANSSVARKCNLFFKWGLLVAYHWHQSLRVSGKVGCNPQRSIDSFVIDANMLTWRKTGEQRIGFVGTTTWKQQSVFAQFCHMLGIVVFSFRKSLKTNMCIVGSVLGMILLLDKKKIVSFAFLQHQIQMAAVLFSSQKRENHSFGRVLFCIHKFPASFR